MMPRSRRSPSGAARKMAFLFSGAGLRTEPGLRNAAASPTGKPEDPFKIAWSSRRRRFSRRSLASSSRSSLARAPGGPLPSSMSARRIQLRSEVSTMSRSFATWLMPRSPTRQRRTASALNSSENVRRFRHFTLNLSMDHSWRAFSLSWVSTEVRQAQHSVRRLGRERDRRSRQLRDRRRCGPGCALGRVDILNRRGDCICHRGRS